MDNEFEIRRKKIEDVLCASLPEKISKDWQNAEFGPLSEAVIPSSYSGLTEPCRSLFLNGGKRWRPLLLVLCAEMAGEALPEGSKNTAINNAYKLTPLLEFAHTASLIHDDIEDGADLRRGKPCAHITYGLDTALNAGSWLYFHAAACIESIDGGDAEKYKIFSLFARELRRLHLGQALDIAWHRDSNYFPTQEEYKAMTGCKTGTLASLAAKTGFLAGGVQAALIESAGEKAAGIGIGFQILDDVQNLTTGNPGKMRGDDIFEGKKSLPVLIHISKNPGDKKKISELFEKAKKSGSPEKAAPCIEEFISLLESSGSIKEAFQEGKFLVKQKAEELTKLCSGSKASDLILELFSKMLPADGRKS